MQTKRSFIIGAAATLATPLVVNAQEAPDRNSSSFAAQDWQDHFSTLGNGAILADITSRALHYLGVRWQLPIVPVLSANVRGTNTTWIFRNCAQTCWPHVDAHTIHA